MRLLLSLVFLSVACSSPAPRECGPAVAESARYAITKDGAGYCVLCDVSGSIVCPPDARYAIPIDGTPHVVCASDRGVAADQVESLVEHCDADSGP